MLVLTGVVLTLTWGVLAFGSVYPWTYQPLIIASALVGLAGLWGARRQSSLPGGLVATLALLLTMISFQLIPLSQSQLIALTPNAIPIIKAREFGISVDDQITHPITIDRYQTVLGLVFFSSFSLLMLGTARMLTRERAEQLLSTLAMLGAAVAIIGIAQKAISADKIYGVWSPVQGRNPFGPFVNKNHFAGWMLMAIPATVGYLLALVNRGTRGANKDVRSIVLWFSTAEANKAMLTAFAVAIMALALVLTLSRSGISTLGVVLTLACSIAVTRQTQISSRVAVGAYFVLLVIGVLVWAGADQLVARFSDFDINDVHERPAIWADTVRIVRGFWLTGTGLNTYGVSTLFYQTSSPESHLREAHNDYLQLAAEGGLMLGIPILAVIATFIHAVRRRFRQDVGSIWWFRMGAVTGLIAIALQSVVEFSLQMPGNAALFAVLAGVALHNGNNRVRN